MKLFYIIYARFPTEKAHGYQVAKMCEALAKQGFDLTLLLPARKNTIQQEAFDYYHIDKSFKIKYFKVLNPFWLGKYSFWLSQLFFAKSVNKFLQSQKDFTIFSRDPFSVYFSQHKNIFIEIHNTVATNWFWKKIINKVQGVISTNNYKKQRIINDFNKTENDILVYPNGVDLGKYENKLSKIEARQKLSLAQDKKIVLYAGNLFGWKGAHILAQTRELLAEDVNIVFVGGSDKVVHDFKKKYQQIGISILGHQPQKMMPIYMQAADILVLPNIPVTEESRFATSPIKLFEYMASGRPIIVSDLPAIKEIVDDSSVYLFTAGDIKELAKSIKHVLNNEQEANNKAVKAFQDVKKYTWHQRAQVIGEFINNYE